MPNCVQLSPAFYASLPGSPSQSKTVAGAIVTFDCDYTPISDNMRTRPPLVLNINISNIKVGNGTKDGKTASCFRAIVILGPVASDYNGAGPMPPVVPVTGVTIIDCDFGTPVNTAQPWFLHNVHGLTMNNNWRHGA